MTVKQDQIEFSAVLSREDADIIDPQDYLDFVEHWNRSGKGSSGGGELEGSTLHIGNEPMAFEHENSLRDAFAMDMDFSLGGGDDMRISRRTERPVQLERERSVLRNDPHRSADKEPQQVYRSDRIPLLTYRRMSNDATIGQAQDLLVGLVSSLKYSLKLPHPEENEVLKRIYQRHHERIISEIVRKGRQNGFCFGQKRFFRRRMVTYERDGDGQKKKIDREIIDLREIKWIDPETPLRYYLDQDERLTYIEQDQQKGQVRITRNRLFWYTNNESFGRIFGSSSFKRPYPYWHYGKKTFQHALRHIQKVGSPHIEARYPDGFTIVEQGGKKVKIPNRKLVLKMAQAIKATGGVAIPNTFDKNTGERQWTLEYKYPDNNSAANWVEFMSYLDSKKLQGLSVPDAVLASKSNYSETDAKIEILMVIIEDLLNQIETVIVQDLLEPIVSYNFGNDRIDSLVFAFDRGALGRRKMLKELVINAMRIGSQMKGYKMKDWIDLKAAFIDLGAPVLTFEDFFEKDEGHEPEGPDLAKAADKQDRDNDTNQNRPNPTERDDERDSKVGE